MLKKRRKGKKDSKMREKTYEDKKKAQEKIGKEERRETRKRVYLF